MAGSLPADVLVELFRLLPEPETLIVHGLFNVAGVNQAWRAAALSCGTLWPCIHTTKQRDCRLLPLLLERSRTAPLDIRLDLFCRAYGIAPMDTTPGTRLHAWPTLLARTLVELDITAKGTPLDMDLIATIFQQCCALTHSPLSSPVSHPRFVPPPSLRVLDLHMPMPDILAILRLFAHAPPLHSITVCDDKGLRPRDGQTMFAPTDHPILEYMIAGSHHSSPLKCTPTRRPSCRTSRGGRGASASTPRMARVWTRARSGFSSSRAAAHAGRGGLELRICVDPNARAQFPLTLPTLRKLTLHPAKYTNSVNISIKGVLVLLSMARTHAGSVVVCLGEVLLDVPPHRALARASAPRGIRCGYRARIVLNARRRSGTSGGGMCIAGRTVEMKVSRNGAMIGGIEDEWGDGNRNCEAAS
ncbi:hypothetical protein B0H13DRAFT_1909173 [Mycena leptocephala]|nr:hypothetical protein B0H13DRAFT_1909173 [Mycena leptocephala]